MPDGDLNIHVACAPKMRPFWTTRRRHKIARGGRGSAKSWTVARMLAARGAVEPIRWLCGREVQKSIKESSMQLLVDQIDGMGLRPLYEIQRDQIIGANGTRFAFTGLREHTATSIKSYEGFDGAWIEEAQDVSDNSANVLIPTIRKPQSELWWTYNPTRKDDYVHKLADSGRDDVLVIDINWRDNRWFPAVLEQERVALQRINEALYRHVWEGECRSNAGVLFKRDWFRRYDAAPERLNVYMASDYAVTPDDGDWTEHGVFGIDERGELYALDWWSGQTDPDTWIRAWLALVRRWKPIEAFEEKGVILRAVDGSIDRAMRESQAWTRRHPIASAGSKLSRALGFAARASAGTVWFPNTEWADAVIEQLCAFDGEDGHVDDKVDVCSLVGRGIGEMANPLPAPGPKKDPPQPFTQAWFDARDNANAKDDASKQRYYR